jgi:putative ABC transport system permease protein
MLHNPLAAAFHNLFRDKFYSGIMILGLAVGFAAAILIGLYVNNEYSFEHFISGYQQVYRLETDMPGPGGGPQRTGSSPSTAAAQLALDFPEVDQVARLALSSQFVGEGEAKSWERVAWVDPEFFKVMPFPVLAGDPVAAMHEPNGVVLTRATARKYFGQDTPIGETLLVQHVDGDPEVHPMVVRAVLEDPGDTHLEQFKIFAAGLAAWSRLADFDRRPIQFPIAWTYVKLRSGALADDVRAGLPAFAARHYASDFTFRLEAIKDLHLTPGVRAVNAGIAAIGALIIVVAAINFVMLITALGTHRAVEVGVRKVLGARRRELIMMFIGEALVYVVVALSLSLAIVKLALPPIKVFLQRAIAFDFFGDPALAAAVVGAALLTGLISGLYPAAVLSGVRPAPALKGGGGRLMGSAQVRQALVVVQFAILTGLIIVAATIWRQTAFILNNIYRLNQDQVLYIGGPCEQTFKQELKAIAGVSAVTCASEAVGGLGIPATVRDPVQETVTINTIVIDVGFFEMHGLQPLAGRFFSEDRGQDMVLDRAERDPEAQPTVVLNESAARQLGFESPAAAVGTRLDWLRPFAAPSGSPPEFRSSEVVGVVPDFTLMGTLRKTIEPTMYYVDPPGTSIIFIRFEESRLSETLHSLEDLWHRSGHVRPMYVEFLGETTRLAYRDVLVQGPIIAASTGLAILIACLGLFAQVVFTTERQTKEIGVRKVMGASSLDVVRLLLWRFTKPVLWANVIAWPIAFWAASRWLEGFAYRVSLPFWLFFAASALALLIAWATIGTKTWLAAHARPATAIRNE